MGEGRRCLNPKALAHDHMQALIKTNQVEVCVYDV